ncbi:MAG: HAD family hydrolase [Planctomycetota bacterium]
MSKRPFDAVFLDFYGTLSAGDRQAVHDACEKVVDTFRLPSTVDELAVQWGERFFATIERSNHDSFKTLYQCECESLKETIGPTVGEFDPAPFVEILETYWRNPGLHDDVQETLAKLDLPTCCVSNADTAALHNAINTHGLTFHAITTSESTRCYKPRPEIFRNAAQIMDVDPKRVIHVGDSLHSDVSGAAKLGITTAWLCRSERIHDIGQAKADHTIHSLSQLLEII